MPFGGGINAYFDIQNFEWSMRTITIFGVMLIGLVIFFLVGCLLLLLATVTFDCWWKLGAFFNITDETVQSNGQLIAPSSVVATKPKQPMMPFELRHHWHRKNHDEQSSELNYVFYNDEMEEDDGSEDVDSCGGSPDENALMFLLSQYGQTNGHLIGAASETKTPFEGNAKLANGNGFAHHLVTSLTNGYVPGCHHPVMEFRTQLNASFEALTALV